MWFNILAITRFNYMNVAPTGLCTLEARSEGNIDALFALGEYWLLEHRDWNEEKFKKQPLLDFTNGMKRELLGLINLNNI